MTTELERLAFSSWSYRLIDHGGYVAIHAVYVRDGKPWLYQEEPEKLLEYKGGYHDMPTVREELAEQLQRLGRALALPALKASDFGGGG